MIKTRNHTFVKHYTDIKKNTVTILITVSSLLRIRSDFSKPYR